MEKSVIKSLFKTVLLLVLSSSLLSCAVSQDEMLLLERSIMSYERAVRWGDFTRAKSFHKSNPTLSDLERRRLKLYRVTGYSTLSNDTRDEHNAYLLVEIKYIKKDKQVMKTYTLKQHWKRDKDSQIWYLDSPFPKLK